MRAVWVPVISGEFTLIDLDDLPLYESGRWYCNMRADKRYVYGYFKSGRSRDRVKLHRLIADCPADKVVDHINGDPLDNRRANLRVCTSLDNNRNRRKYRHGYKGVYFIKPRSPNRKPRWQACIEVRVAPRRTKRINLGFYDTREEAALAYNLAAIQRFGGHTCLNDLATGSVSSPCWG